MIAVDVMGGDYAPQEAVQGALEAAKQGIPLILFGNQDKVMPLLVHYCPRWRTLPIELVHCADVIGMEEDPLRAILRKKDSSITCGLAALADDRATAFVSAGNSGAVVMAASVTVGRVSGVSRPAIGSFLPTVQGTIFVLDLGANPDCKPEHLVQFAYFGHAYVRLVKQIAQPKIALLSNGHEPYKGSVLVKQAYDLLLKTDLEFIGNIESRDLFAGHVDVIVTDGFTGNVLLKGIQGTAKVVVDFIKEEAGRSWALKMVLALMRPVFIRMKSKIDYAKRGGALLLGVNKPVIIAHGSSKAESITQSILFAHQVVKDAIVPTFNSSLVSLLQRPCNEVNKIQKETLSDQVHP